jgi:hypothetical protein
MVIQAFDRVGGCRYYLGRHQCVGEMGGLNNESFAGSMRSDPGAAIWYYREGSPSAGEMVGSNSVHLTGSIALNPGAAIR